MLAFFSLLTLMARLNHLSPQCSQATLIMSVFNAQSISRQLSNQLVILQNMPSTFL